MPPPTARSMGTVCCALQYHASYPRDKRLVQLYVMGTFIVTYVLAERCWTCLG